MKHRLILRLLGRLTVMLWLWSVGAILLIVFWPKKLNRIWQRWLRFCQKWPTNLRLLIALLVGLLPPYLLLYFPWHWIFTPKWLWGIALWLASGLLVGLLLGQETEPKPSTAPMNLLLGLARSGALFAFAAAYTGVSNAPFVQSGSNEAGNILWAYSLTFARQRYLYPTGQPIWVYLDTGRKILWGLIFLIPGIPLIGVRFWNALLWSVPHLGIIWWAFRRNLSERQWLWALTLWGFLFLNQGPIYAPLILSLGLILLAVYSGRLLWGVPLALAAGYLTGITRYTWVLAPMLWVGLFLPWPRHRKTSLTLGAAALLGTALSGGLTAFIAAGWAVARKMLPVLPPFPLPIDPIAASHPNHPLLWYRLLPNANFTLFGLGLMLGLLLALVPLMLAWVAYHRRHLAQTLRHFDFWYSALVLSVFLLQGIVVSVKIGGGDNLHNFDLFLVTLVALVIHHAPRITAWLSRAMAHSHLRAVLLSALLVPMLFTVQNATPHLIPPASATQEALGQLATYLKQPEGEVLFISHRHLLTFHLVPQVPLVPEYEGRYLIEQAMAGDAGYFAAYYRDLARQRFAYIISGPLRIVFQTPGKQAFAEENNAWVHWVVLPTLCYYAPVYTNEDVGLQILAPRPAEATRGCPYAP